MNASIAAGGLHSTCTVAVIGTLLLRTLHEQARQMGVPGPNNEDFPAELELTNQILFEVDLQNGWPVAIQRERRRYNCVPKPRRKREKPTG
jgi:hypothetical protein